MNPADGITSYPVLYLPTLQSYLNLPVLMYGHGGSSPRLGANVVNDIYGYNFPNYYGAVNSVGIDYSYSSGLSGNSLVESGDSSSPTFVPVGNGRLALLGTHSLLLTSGGSNPSLGLSVDNFIPYYAVSMANDGINFSIISVVPEPSRFLLLLLGACALLWRRHRV